MNCINFTTATGRLLKKVLNDKSINNNLSLVDIMNQIKDTILNTPNYKKDKGNRFIGDTNNNKSSAEYKHNEIEKMFLLAYLSDETKLTDITAGKGKGLLNRIREDDAFKEANDKRIPLSKDTNNVRFKAASRILAPDWVRLQYYLNNVLTNVPIISFNNKGNIDDLIKQISQEDSLNVNNKETLLYLLTGAMPIKYTTDDLTLIGKSGVEMEIKVGDLVNGVQTYKVFQGNDVIGELYPKLDELYNSDNQEIVRGLTQKYGLNEETVVHRLNDYRAFFDNLTTRKYKLDNTYIRKGKINEEPIVWKKLKGKYPNLLVGNNLMLDTRPYIPILNTSPKDINANISGAGNFSGDYQNAGRNRNPHRSLKAISEVLLGGKQATEIDPLETQIMLLVGELKKGTLKSEEISGRVRDFLNTMVNGSVDKIKLLENDIDFLTSHIRLMSIGLVPNPAYMNMYVEYEFTKNNDERLEKSENNQPFAFTPGHTGKIMVSFTDNVLNKNFDKIIELLDPIYEQISEASKPQSRNEETIKSLKSKARYICDAYFTKYHFDSMLRKGVFNALYANKSIKVPKITDTDFEDNPLVKDGVFYKFKVKDEKGVATGVEEVNFSPEGFMNLLHKIKTGKAMKVITKVNSGKVGERETGEETMTYVTAVKTKLDEYLDKYPFSFTPDASNYDNDLNRTSLEQTRTIKSNSAFMMIDTKANKEISTIDLSEVTLGGIPYTPNLALDIKTDTKKEQIGVPKKYGEREVTNILTALLNNGDLSMYEIDSVSMDVFKGEIEKIQGTGRDIKRSITVLVAKLKSENVVCK